MVFCEFCGAYARLLLCRSMRKQGKGELTKPRGWILSSLPPSASQLPPLIGRTANASVIFLCSVTSVLLEDDKRTANASVIFLCSVTSVLLEDDKRLYYPNLVVSNPVVFNFYAEALFCALLRPFELFCALAFPLFCAHLRTFACFYVRPRLERPRFILGSAENVQQLTWKMVSSFSFHSLRISL